MYPKFSKYAISDLANVSIISLDLIIHKKYFYIQRKIPIALVKPRVNSMRNLLYMVGKG